MVTASELSESERAKIRDAIAEAEAVTTGEIFVVIARVSDNYRSIPILWATIIALCVPLPLLLMTQMPTLDVYLVQLATFALIATFLSLPRIHILTVPRRVKQARSHDRAVEQFLAHGLHMTEARTGALIFVSLAERYAEIVADAGIASKVPQLVWDDAIGKLTGEIRNGRLAQALVVAVRDVGAVLAANFPPGLDDRNELINDVVLL